MLYDNSYNRSIADRLRDFDLALAKRTEYSGTSTTGGSGFAKGTRYDTGLGSTLGASPSNTGLKETTEFEGGNMKINTVNSILMGGAADTYDRYAGKGDNELRGDGWWDNFKSGFDGVADTVGKVADVAGKVIPIALAVAPIAKKLMGGGDEEVERNIGAGELTGPSGAKLIESQALPSSSMGGASLSEMQKAQNLMTNANLAFGGMKVTKQVLDFVNKVEPHFKLGKNILEKLISYDIKDPNLMKKVLGDVFKKLTGTGKDKFKAMSGVEGGGLLGTIFNAIGLGKGSEYKEFFKKSTKKTGAGILGTVGGLIDGIFGLGEPEKEVSGSGILGTVGSVIDNIFGFGKPDFEQSVKGFGAELEAAKEGGRKKVKLSDRLVPKDDTKVLSKYSQLVKDIMKAKGLKMKDALKHIKENGLYKK